MQTDPSGYSDGMNLYAFVHNAPIGSADPTGLDTKCEEVKDGEFKCEVDGPRDPPDDPGPGYLPPDGPQDPGKGGGGGGRQPKGRKPDKPCTPSTLGQAIARNTTWNFGAGVGLGGKLFGFINVEAFNAYGGWGGNFAGQTWGYISGGGPAVEAKLGVARVGFSTGGGETRFGDHYFEASSERAFLGFSSDAGTLKYGNRLEAALIDAGISLDIAQMWRDWRCNKP